jgi:DNA-binding XRE family transcriptional regulator
VAPLGGVVSSRATKFWDTKGSNIAKRIFARGPDSAGSPRGAVVDEPTPLGITSESVRPGLEEMTGGVIEAPGILRAATPQALHALVQPAAVSPIPGEPALPTAEPPKNTSQVVEASQSKRLPVLPDAFPNGVGKIPHNPVVSAHIAAISKAGEHVRNLKNGWYANSAGSPIYTHTKRGSDGQIVIYTDIPRGIDEAPAKTEEEWFLLERTNPAWALDVLITVIAQLCERGTIAFSMYVPAEESCRPTLFTAPTVLRQKGIRRFGEERKSFYGVIDEAMEFLKCLKFEASWPVTDIDKKTGKEKYHTVKWKDDQLLDIATHEDYQPSLYDGHNERLVAVQWFIRFGQWARFWFNSERTPWIAQFARSLLRLDHRRNSGPHVLAKKIGIFLALHMATKRGEPVDIHVSTLLERIGELPTEPNHNWAGRQRDRFNSALAILVKAGYLQWKWSDDSGGNEEDRRRGWVRRWLEKKLVLHLLPSDQPLIPAEEGERRRRQLTSEDFRQARIEHRWSQQEMALYLKISTTLLSYFENGKRKRLPAYAYQRICELSWFPEFRD